MAACLVEILLPLEDNQGKRISHTSFTRVKNELAQRFKGVTAFTQSPAEGQWITGGKKVRDQVIVIEVMTGRLERRWWTAYRKALERRFRQRSIVIRMLRIELL